MKIIIKDEKIEIFTNEMHSLEFINDVCRTNFGTLVMNCEGVEDAIKKIKRNSENKGDNLKVGCEVVDSRQPMIRGIITAVNKGKYNILQKGGYTITVADTEFKNHWVKTGTIYAGIEDAILRLQ